MPRHDYPADALVRHVHAHRLGEGHWGVTLTWSNGDRTARIYQTREKALAAARRSAAGWYADLTIDD